MTSLEGKRVLVTGGTGFLGSHVVGVLKARGAMPIAYHSYVYDLVDQEQTWELIRSKKPDLIIHLAARCGGIGANQSQPGKFFFDNLTMGLNVFEEARLAGVEKVVAVATVCSYPKYTPGPFKERDLWNGYPEETNAPYGLAKKMLLVQSQAYRQQYGFNSVVLFPANLYGPRDNFDLETSHVIPAMIRKIAHAVAEGVPEVKLWGDGTPTRDFLYVEDCAEAIVHACEVYNSSEPLNLGFGRPISMDALAYMIAGELGFKGRFIWDTSRPSGQPNRWLDTTRAREQLGWRATTTLDVGLRKTIKWWRASLPVGTTCAP